MVPRVRTEARKIYSYSKGDYEGFNNSFGLTEWEELLSSKSIETNWDNYKKRFNELIVEHIPHKFVKAGQWMKLPWTRYKSVKRAKKKHPATKVAARKSGLHADQLITDNAKRDTNSAIISAKTHYESKIIDQSAENPKRFWNYTPTLHKILELHRRTRVKREEIHKGLRQSWNSFFCSVLTDEPPLDSTTQGTPTTNPIHILRDIVITADDVRKRLVKLQANKASGPDSISVNVLRNSPHLDIPLQILFNQSIQTGQVPQDWGDANISPIHKKGSRSKSSNNRPVSLPAKWLNLWRRFYTNTYWTLLPEIRPSPAISMASRINAHVLHSYSSA